MEIDLIGNHSYHMGMTNLSIIRHQNKAKNRAGQKWGGYSKTITRKWKLFIIRCVILNELARRKVNYSFNFTYLKSE